MPLTPIFHPQEDWYQAMVTKNKGSLKATNRQEEWYEEIVDSMASGSGGGVLVVHDVDGTLDKTWQEIHDAMLSGGAVIDTDENETDVSTVLRVYVGKGTYFVISADDSAFSASSASDYPSALIN